MHLKYYHPAYQSHRSFVAARLKDQEMTCKDISISSSLKVIDVRTGGLRRYLNIVGLNCLPRKPSNYYAIFESAASVYGRSSYTVYGARGADYRDAAARPS